jgi:hypothetical protein
MNILIIIYTINWVYRLYEEYIISLKKFIEKYYDKIIDININYYDIDIYDKKNVINKLDIDNYDRILNFVHNNSLSKSPWENQELKQIYIFFKKLRNE